MDTSDRKEYARQYYLRNRDKILARNKKRHAEKREEINQKARRRYYDRPDLFPARMLDRARQRARQLGQEFSITVDDIVIPEKCPVYGIKLERNLGGNTSAPNSPSLDRIDSSKGYVPGNVQVISMKANMLKRDSTPEELRKFARWVLGVFPDSEEECDT